MSRTAIRRIRRLYYDATRRTIERDLREAIELLAALPDDASRAAAAVYMDGLSQMRSEWRLEAKRASTPAKKKTTTGGRRTKKRAR